ncbi:MAG: SMP-30/gluconolactonase/LRE family protein [Acidobacteriota bacterium]|nr:SMP-30/gluconolactonase/LRE family protein [Acidobacteriota bacterium]
MRTPLLLAALALPLWAQSAGIPGVVAAGVEPELVKDGFMFTEGPVGTPDGGLFFTDIRANKIYRIDPDGKITTVRMNTGGANGLALNQGELYAAEGRDKLISRGNQNGRNTTVIDTSSAPLLGAPNDLIFDIRGGFYFTDPGATPMFPKVAGQVGKVYYVASSVGIPPYPIDDMIARPNGLTLTLDGRYLLVDDTLGDTIWSFEVQPKVKSKGGVKKAEFAKIPLLTEGESLADGMAIDREGRVYVATGAGIQVFDKKGKFLGNIKVPKVPSNLAFSGPDKKTLYITAREAVYKLKMLSQGPERQGK